MIIKLKKYTLPLIGVLFILSGAYEAIFDDASYTLYLPLLAIGILLLYTPAKELSTFIFNKINK